MKKNKLLQVAFFVLPMMLFSLWSFAQTLSVKGTVTDDKGEPLPGVNVVVKGTTVGSVTDVNGKYQIDASAKSTLTFSFIGYKSQEVPVANKKELNIKLILDNSQVDEVVVVGYGTQKKSDISGSVASVSGQEMLRKAPTNIAQGIQGAAAGVMVVAQDGAPDANAAIRIRGVATINGTANPLYVVDGVQVGTNSNFLTPSDIESVEILKDASATAIYGSAGANGVIMITTKHGKAGTTHITFSADYGVQTLSSTLAVGDIDPVRSKYSSGTYQRWRNSG